jgi:hypothetical protein
MPSLRIYEIDGPCQYDFLIDASEREDCDLFRLVFLSNEIFRTVLIKVIGIGVPPKALAHNGTIIILANASVWRLEPAASIFRQHNHQFPVIDYAETEHGLLVFDNIGCIMLHYGDYDVAWRFHQNVLVDYAVDGEMVRLMFDSGSAVTLRLLDGTPISADI